MPRKVRAQNDSKAKERDALLEELESIKTLLDEPEPNADIPLLEEIIDERPQASGLDHGTTVLNSEDETTANISSSTAPGVLPGQQSLFKEKQQESAKTTNTRQVRETSPKTHENPFLPQHIRRRLSSNKVQTELEMNLANHIPQVPLAPPQQASKSLSEEQQDQLIDSLVAEFLPKIEARLRQKLSYILQNPEKPSDS